MRYKPERNLGTKSLGVEYYSVEKTDCYNIDTSIDNDHHRFAANVYHKPPIQMLVFICKASKSFYADSFLSCKDQIIQIVVQKKLPFILCLEQSNDALSKSSNEIATQMKKAMKTLQASLEKSYWILMTEGSPGT